MIEAADGPEGLALVETDRPDCILLDLVMPGLSGFEVLERLQTDPRTREIPVIILTATGASLDNMERGLLGGAVDYLTKPISPPQVVVRVRGAIERRRLLQEVQDLRASFTSMLVHDLRSPMTVLVAYTDLIAQGTMGPVTPKQTRCLGKIRQSCNQMLRLIGEILDVSKLDAGRLTLECTTVDVAGLISEMAERFEGSAKQAGVRLEVRGAEQPALVRADPRRLDQVLMNLVGNALKFTPAGGAVTLEVAGEDDAVEVTVSDTGPGIAPKEMPLLFQPFRQASAGRRAGATGTGLGLVVARHLVEAHGGRIWAESEPGQGARFAFRLPRAGSGKDGRAVMGGGSPAC